MKKIDEQQIEVVSICDVDAPKPEDFDFDWDKLVPAFQAWCRENGFWYYARPREDFFIFEAVEEAAANGFKKVLVEDLS